MATNEETGNTRGRSCAICNRREVDGKSPEAMYTCPRCSIVYCSLTCYRNPAHEQCTEGFYRDCVREELQSHRISDDAKSGSSKKRPITFEELMRERGERDEEAVGVEEGEEGEEVLDSDDEPEEEDDHAGDDAYLEQVSRSTVDEWPTANDADLDRRLTAAGVACGGGDDDLASLYATLTAAERREFERLADRLNESEQQLGRSVFRKRGNRPRPR